jgi:glutaconate CoA-transferase subunit A
LSTPDLTPRSGEHPVRATKVEDLPELVARVPDGARIAFGGFPMFSKPMAFVHELIRQGKRDLTVVGTSNGIEIDLLAAAGAIATIETAYVGLEEFGLAPSFRRAAEAGELAIVDYPEGVAFDRFRASQEGLTFVATAQLVGTDMAARNPDVVLFACPITGRPYHAVPAANVDIAVIHAPATDVFGNVLYPQSRLLPQGLDLTMACAADTVLVTTERVVDHGFVLKHPELTQIPAFRTTAAAHAPWGAHPTALPGFYEVDAHFMRDVYVPASGSREEMAGFLERYVSGLGTHDGYLELVGPARLMRAERWGVV